MTQKECLSLAARELPRPANIPCGRSDWQTPHPCPPEPLVPATAAAWRAWMFMLVVIVGSMDGGLLSSLRGSILGQREPDPSRLPFHQASDTAHVWRYLKAGNFRGSARARAATAPLRVCNKPRTRCRTRNRVGRMCRELDPRGIAALGSPPPNNRCWARMGLMLLTACYPRDCQPAPCNPRVTSGTGSGQTNEANGGSAWRSRPDRSSCPR